MREKKSDANFKSKYVVIYGDVLLAIGVIGIVFEWVRFGRNFDIGYNVVVAVIGVCTALLGKALLAIEARIRRLEDRSANQSGDVAQQACCGKLDCGGRSGIHPARERQRTAMQRDKVTRDRQAQSGAAR